jgi:hypothetical protein
MAKAEVVEVMVHALAPAKPVLGQPCNGCGVCCALSVCPLGRLIYWQIHGPCPGSRWVAELRRYQCSLLDRHQDFAREQRTLVGRWVSRAIAAGRGCDFDASIEPDQ